MCRYDFAVFGYLSDIIGDNFFPKQEGDAALIESLSVFGIAFIMRPIGGILLGYIGDKYGRKFALEISTFLMAFPTLCMGCLPTYEQVGYLATFLLVCVRLLQGLSVGGQVVSSLVFTLENQPKERWGLYGSLVISSANFGTLFASFVIAILESMVTEDQMKDWGWRLPFLMGILVGLNGLYLHFYCDEDVMEHNSGDNSDEPQNPIKGAFSAENRKSLLSATLVTMLWSGGFYITFVWLTIFMVDDIEPPIKDAFMINCYSLVLSMCAFCPVAGFLSDVFGRIKVMSIGGLSVVTLSPIIIMLVSRGNPTTAFFAQLTLGISISLWGAPMMAWLVESFPSHVRLTSVAVGYNMAHMFIGGSSPALCTIFVAKYGPIVPGFFLSCIATLSLIGLCIQPAKPMEYNSSMNNVRGESGSVSYDTF